MINRGIFALAATSIWLLGTCKKEQTPASYPVPIGTPVTALPASGAPALPAAPPPLPGAPAVGMPCGSDQDLQCPFSHCVANHCGGCTSSAACKPGSQCLPTWLGNACLPSPARSPNVPVPASSPNVPVPVSTPSSDPLEALRARCVQRSNELRARVTPGALMRQASHEACEDSQAQADAATGTAHGAFGRCQEAGQNECPGWPGPLDQLIDKCLAQMFAEGPGTFSGGHGHYLNLVDPAFHGVACGFSTAPNGKIWLIQDFYR